MPILSRWFLKMSSTFFMGILTGVLMVVNLNPTDNLKASFLETDIDQGACSLLRHVQKIANDVLSEKIVSAYSYENKIFLDNMTGKTVYACNCYGFIWLVLGKLDPRVRSELLVLMTEFQDKTPLSIDGIPCPANYLTIFNQLAVRPAKYWQNVLFNALRPGDIISYVQPGYVLEAIPTHNGGRTGTHVMIIDKIFEKSEHRVHLSIIDATRSPHNKISDTRSRSLTMNHGIGSSELFILMNLDGKPTHISWSFLGKKIAKEIAVGRIKPPQIARL